MSKVFMVYLLANRKNGTLYAGVTGYPERRIMQHKGALLEGFTKRYAIDRLVWFEFFEDARLAIQREKQIKEWRRAWKIALIEEKNPDWRDLSREIIPTI
jgi:putative endonuclease